MKALRMRRRMNFSESLSVALWCGKEEVPGDRVGILRPDRGRSAGVVMVGNGSGRTCLWGGPRRAGRGGRFTNATFVVAAESPSGFIISSLLSSVRKPKSGAVPQQRSDGPAAERSSSSWKKDKTRSNHSFITSPPQQAVEDHPPKQKPQNNPAQNPPPKSLFRNLHCFLQRSAFFLYPLLHGSKDRVRNKSELAKKHSERQAVHFPAYCDLHPKQPGAHSHSGSNL